MNKPKKVLAISSAGGHWIQLQRLKPVFQKYQTVYACTNKSYSKDVHPCDFFRITDATRWNKLKMIKLMAETFFIIRKIKPEVVITTGAAPGLWAVIFGKLAGARTVWIDSIANVEKLSMSGRLCKRFADLHLTQWPNLQNNKTKYKGNIIS